MKLMLKAISLAIVLFTLMSTLTVSSAYGHGVGGIEPTQVLVVVDSVNPQAGFFKAESIENGERFRITRTSSIDFEVLGVDSEPYLLFNSNGVFVNLRSATRLINKSSSEDSSTEVTAEDFANTSTDPNDEPNWQRVSKTQSYAWHDHRTHYMGSIAEELENLGETSLEIKAQNKTHVITILFVASDKDSNLFALIALAVALIGLTFFVFVKKKTFQTYFASKVASVTFLVLLTMSESTHIIGYFRFSQQSFWREISSTMYSIGLVLIALIALLRILISKTAKQNWDLAKVHHAPILSLTGFIGIFVGAIFEYKIFLYPNLPTIYPNLVSIGLVCIVALCSHMLLLTGLQNIKSIDHNEEHSKASLD